MGTNEFFERRLGAKLGNPRQSWGSIHPTTHEVFLRVWADELARTDGGERILLLVDSPNRRGRGVHERRKHIALIQSGTVAYGVVCTATDPRAKVRTTKAFEPSPLLKLGCIFREGDQVYAQVLGRVPTERVVPVGGSDSQLSEDLRGLEMRGLDATSKQVLADARIGQGQFREDVLHSWGFRCAVTGSTTIAALRASHIKPWHTSSDIERRDPNNGLPLVATLDALFDAGLLTFRNDGKILVSPRLTAEERGSLPVNGKQLSRRPQRAMQKYLQYHRENVFQGET